MSEKALVADDEYDAIFLMTIALNNLGYTVITAPNVSIAQDRLRENTDIAIVVSDGQLPETGWQSLLRFVRTQPNLANVPFIVFTAMDSYQRDVKTLGDPYCQYLAKTQVHRVGDVIASTRS